MMMMFFREKRRQEMQTFIKPNAPGIKLKADFDKLNRDIVSTIVGSVLLKREYRICQKQQLKNWELKLEIKMTEITLSIWMYEKNNFMTG